jgi:hypothetical protein
MAGGEGYAQAGAATFDTAVNWLLYGQEKEIIGKWRKEDLALAKEAQQYALSQQLFQNKLSQTESNLAQGAFDFGKQKWGQEFGLTKKQMQQNMNIAKSQEGRTQEAFDITKKKNALSMLKDNLNSVLSNDFNMKNKVAAWMGAGYGGR